MKKSTLCLLAAGVATWLVGCGPTKDSSTPEAVKNGYAEMKLGKTLDVASFQGGYGIDMFETFAQEYAKKAGITATVKGDPRIWIQLQPRFVGGTPPDLTWPGWGMDYWRLVKEGQLLQLDDALDSMADDGKTKWRDTFEPGLLALGQEEGKTWMLPYHFNINGWWANKGVFDKAGLAIPKTYEELLTVGEALKAKGVAPITFQGQYPYYAIFGFVLPWSISSGGMKALDDMQNLVPGAWKSPAVIKSAEMIKELRDKGFFEKGATGLSHTESQTDFLLGKAAMIPCGTWLYAEMKDVWPAGAQAVFMLPPTLKDGQDPSNVCVGIEPWVIPAKAKNPRGGIDLYKFMTSQDNAVRFIEAKGTLMGIKGANEKAKLPAHLVEPARLFGESKAVWSPMFSIWYPKFKKAIEGATAKLLNGEITPVQFGDECEAAAEELRNDAKVIKHKYARG